MSTTLNADGLVQSIIRIVAEASMKLPPLVHSYDAEFLRTSTTKAIGIFWQRYLDQLEGSARSEWMTMAHQEDFGSIADWVISYADFENDAGVAVRAEKALAEVKTELLKSIEDDYTAFVSKHSA